MRPPRGTGEKLHECGDRAGSMRREMDVACEQEHQGSAGCIPVGPEGVRGGSNIG